ncbi:hypothetical protein CPC08DRAFT_272145 [Agrocybe pediades]|nr:hypothetical protein CPC08DRAFT_272145 [Agrocybe pediades]
MYSSITCRSVDSLEGLCSTTTLCPCCFAYVTRHSSFTVLWLKSPIIQVQTEDQLQTQGAAEKDPKSLSGGEKSFSTICLLLSLWECIGCPLRCLDEFDVFMDAVNRRISMKMMIDTANTSDKKQYILITPQDMNNVTLGPSVRVLRMSDPERGNGTLPFGAAAS